MDTRKLELSPKSLVLFFCIPLGGYLLFRLSELIILLFLSMIFVAALNPLVNRLQKKHFPRSLAILVVYFCFVALLLLIVSFIVPPLVQESITLITRLNLGSYISVVPFSDLQNIFQNYNSLIAQLGGSLQSLLGILFSTFSGIVAVFTFLVVTYYMLVERSNLHKHMVWIFGQTNAELRAQKFIDNLESELGSWVRGQLLLMSVIGVLTFIGLTLLGIPYALPLAILAALLEALPNIGPTISAIPAVLLTLLTVSPTMALIVVLLYVIIQQIENNIVVPRIMASAAKVSPLIAIIVIITGLQLAGIIGTILSVPAFIFLRTLINEYYGGQNPLKSFAESKDNKETAKGR